MSKIDWDSVIREAGIIDEKEYLNELSLELAAISSRVLTNQYKTDENPLGLGEIRAVIEEVDKDTAIIITVGRELDTFEPAKGLH